MIYWISSVSQLVWELRDSKLERHSPLLRMFSITIFLLPSTRSFFTSHMTAHDQDFQILQGASLLLPNSYINLSKQNKKQKNFMTPGWPDMTSHDTWWHMVTQIPRSKGMKYMMSWRLGGKGWWLNEWINQSISYEAVSRTALATPGLLIIQPLYHCFCFYWSHSYFYCFLTPVAIFCLLLIILVFVAWLGPTTLFSLSPLASKSIFFGLLVFYFDRSSFKWKEVSNVKQIKK